MIESAARVFISYHRSDLALAERLRARLVGNQIKTWMDLYDIRPGAYWPDEIDQGLGQSSIVIGILSPDSIASRNVKNEWDWAIQNGKRLILLIAGACVIPHRYVSINHIDATSMGMDQALDTLMNLAELRPVQSELLIPRTRYARSGDVSVAFQELGSGPVDLV